MTIPALPTQHPVPVTLVAGFLGAGKTTLVNRILRDAEGLQLAVLVNDFGTVNIDAELIASQTEDVIALQNGCICCSMTGGLLAAISSVLRRPERPDAIVIEGSGISDPLEVFRTLSDPDLQAHAPLDGILTVVDADGISHLDPDALMLAERQIATGDLILLNKADLVDEEDLRCLERRIAVLAPSGRVLRCTNADVPFSILLGIAPSNALLDMTSVARSSEKAKTGDIFESIAIEREKPISTRALHAMLMGLPDRVYRVKGVLHLVEQPHMRCILQATGRRATITVDAPWESRIPGTRILLIAKKGVLDRSEIERRLDGAPVMERDAAILMT